MIAFYGSQQPQSYLQVVLQVSCLVYVCIIKQTYTHQYTAIGYIHIHTCLSTFAEEIGLVFLALKGQPGIHACKLYFKLMDSVLTLPSSSYFLYPWHQHQLSRIISSLTTFFNR